MRDGLSADVIDIWIWNLEEASTSQAPYLATPLTARELDTAARFVHERDRRRFVAGRSGLRRIVGSYLGIEPNRLNLSYNAYGKPRIAASNGRMLHFNLSHCGGMAALAVSSCYQVGIDIEEVRPLKEDNVSRFLSPKEEMSLAALPAAEYRRAFYSVWTRKEAFVKAIGVGLSFPLDAFDVTVGDSPSPRLERLDADGNRPADWSLFDLEMPPPFVGTLAALTGGRHVSLNYQDENALFIMSSAHPERNDWPPHQNDGSQAGLS
ncbi:4'-phosphopantetheinyl transferase [Rhizobium mongolense subsp. loessense]|uniref:4'-phosphopantetheinyl transferase n=1 Tax=Rhizobium mongolense subsp. loessense TaxID=158890 RepID=A0A1G4SH36_9HYPH|nr:4'-phosphopantetheinyl transferase superfamily protein [Rhizobium mongolense]SCW68378.1 4'-phosphopantetheinyl transferase [Rhizobium mongolense subsp. loessense]